MNDVKAEPIRRLDLPRQVSDYVWMAANVTAELLGDVRPIELFGARRFHQVARGRRVLARVLRETLYNALDGEGRPQDWHIHLREGTPGDPLRPISYPQLGAMFGRHHTAFLAGGAGRFVFHEQAVRIISVLRDRWQTWSPVTGWQRLAETEVV